MLGRERSELENIVGVLASFTESISDLSDLAEMASDEQDEDTLDEVAGELDALEERLAGLEFRRMFQGEMDNANCFLEIQSGSGGTEAQDWSDMLLRMYLRWAEKRQFSARVTELSPGDVAGVKSATVQIVGEYANGWLRTETGVHRLVRKSPFDSGNRRHTSFASVFIAPEIDDDIQIDINPADVRVDTYRASGAGGQHVNTTDSAVRITHLPTNIVVQCQNERSQHKNRATAMKMLKARLYDLEQQELNKEKELLNSQKQDIAWGSQIRSYVLHPYQMVKDHRTNWETGNADKVLGGDLNGLIKEALSQKVC